MTGILKAMVAKIKNYKCFYESVINDGCDILVKSMNCIILFNNNNKPIYLS